MFFNLVYYSGLHNAARGREKENILNVFSSSFTFSTVKAWQFLSRLGMQTTHEIKQELEMISHFLEEGRP